LTTSISKPVYDLLEHRINSFEKLELVIALASAPGATLSISDLARALTLPRDEIRQIATELRGASLVNVTTRDEVQLLPPTSKEGAAINELVELYREERFSVVKALGEISLARIRNLASRAFSDAFILGTKKKRGDDG
jgi:hypothetical protein